MSAAQLVAPREVVGAGARGTAVTTPTDGHPPAPATRFAAGREAVEVLVRP
ncbi:hypothetical protein [Lentzea sp. NEAU-D7]|uniref:hypothetical protein n=1 Tax=Lentzea sp. NEAU-D7 TaxID=2994667 RepID=UPI00224A8BCC|nr:hypothetical protein [Lentzea sp. NEAU-D7]MCX2954731.1 hypothetical protein [Lentzea sp. NEAU-D7]